MVHDIWHGFVISDRCGIGGTEVQNKCTRGDYYYYYYYYSVPQQTVLQEK